MREVRWKDKQGRIVIGAWSDSPIGRAVLHVAEVLVWVVVAVCLCWCLASAADIMPLRCTGHHCARVAP